MNQMLERPGQAGNAEDGGTRAGADIDVRIARIERLSPDVLRYELEPVAAGPLPGFDAGAHIDVHLPNGIVRQYSLSNPPRERHRYVIAVKKQAQGRGGSAFMHERLAAGMCLRVGAPRNHFALDRQAPHSVFIAGGIGLTPFLSMAAVLDELGRSWVLHYAARDAGQLGLLGSWLGHPRVKTYLASEGKGLSMSAAMPVMAEAHVYCCGPESMLSEFEALCAGRHPGTVHAERFAASGAEAGADTAFTLVLARSGRRLPVRPGQTIAQVLREAGVAVSTSCELGICGACETTVLEGRPEHRDSLLTPEEHATGRTMMICCSGSQTEELVLDL